MSPDLPIASRGTSADLQATWLDTPLGPLLAIGHDRALCMLSFSDGQHLLHLKRITKHTSIAWGENVILSQLRQEMAAYFAGKLCNFTLPLDPSGSSFQQRAWDTLCTIPYGKTCSYAEQAQKMGHPKAYRAVGNANGQNPLVIVIPCHRIIQNNGNLGGFGGGVEKKEWLLAHERSHAPRYT